MSRIPQDNTFSGPAYERIYTIVRLIPAGKVSTYGDIASIVGDCTARMVGYAMAAADAHGDVPWHRVINASLAVTEHGGAVRQREKLRAEGVAFDKRGRVNSQLLWP